MSTIQFNAIARKGVIHVPRSHRRFANGRVRVVLLKQDEHPAGAGALARAFGAVKLSVDPLRYQRIVRAEGGLHEVA
jgi:hypothetical protein